jgi:hypothetical protein
MEEGGREGRRNMKKRKCTHNTHVHEKKKKNSACTLDILRSSTPDFTWCVYFSFSFIVFCHQKCGFFFFFNILAFFLGSFAVRAHERYNTNQNKRGRKRREEFILVTSNEQHHLRKEREKQRNEGAFEREKGEVLFLKSSC